MVEAIVFLKNGIHSCTLPTMHSHDLRQFWICIVGRQQSENATPRRTHFVTALRGQ